MNRESKKSVLIFILGLLTFGIANIVYIFIFSDKIIKDHNNRVFYPVREVILNIITLGIYGIIWTLRMSKTLDKREGFDKITSISIISTVVSALPIRCVSMTVIYYRMLCLESTAE